MTSITATGTTGFNFLQMVATGLLNLVLNGTNTTITFIFSLLQTLISAAIYQAGLGTGT